MHAARPASNDDGIDERKRRFDDSNHIRNSPELQNKHFRRDFYSEAAAAAATANLEKCSGCKCHRQNKNNALYGNHFLCVCPASKESEYLGNQENYCCFYTQPEVQSPPKIVLVESTEEEAQKRPLKRVSPSKPFPDVVIDLEEHKEPEPRPRKRKLYTPEPPPVFEDFRRPKSPRTVPESPPLVLDSPTQAKLSRFRERTQQISIETIKITKREEKKPRKAVKRSAVAADSTFIDVNEATKEPRLEKPAEEESIVDPLADTDFEPITEPMSIHDYRYTLSSETTSVPNTYHLPLTTSNTITTTAKPPVDETPTPTASTAPSLADAQPCLATLGNIGNSCYLNSVIYTLRFAPRFLHKLHHLIEDMATIYTRLGQTKLKSSSLGRNVGPMQAHSGRSWSSKDLASLGTITSGDTAPKNARLTVTEKLHELYQSLHRNESVCSVEPFHANSFLQAIQDVSSIFEGNQQQDAHELLMCILDSIRETCDTLAGAIIENPDLLLAEYGYGWLIEEQVAAEMGEMAMQAPATVPEKKKLPLWRKSRRKKEPTPEREMNGGLGSGGGTVVSSAAAVQQPELMALDARNNFKNNLLRTLAGSAADDREKLKANICQLLGLNFFTEDFEGVSVSSIKCLTCETVRPLKEKMIDISVPITGHESSDAMSNPQVFFQNAFITKEYFRGDNKYRCEECSGYTEAIRSISYEVLPRLLVIHLKRFSGGMEKISSYIPTPFTLRCFCNKCIQLADADKLHIYKLYSVITHVGATMSVGHYIAYTCSLDLANEYRTCPNDRDKPPPAPKARNVAPEAGDGAHLSRGGATTPGADVAGKKRETVGLRRFIFGKSKANSSGDISKNFKAVNGMVSKVVANGFERLSQATGGVLGSTVACQGPKCCSIHAKNSRLAGTVNGAVNGEETATGAKTSSSDLSISSTSSLTNATNGNDDEKAVNGVSAGNGTAAAAGPAPNVNQEFWYKCDDDKIKVMDQSQFEELLSPNRKITITPYLLFYARFDADRGGPK